MSDWFIGYATLTWLEEKGNEKEKEKGKGNILMGLKFYAIGWPC